MASEDKSGLRVHYKRRSLNLTLYYFVMFFIGDLVSILHVEHAQVSTRLSGGNVLTCYALKISSKECQVVVEDKCSL